MKKITFILLAIFALSCSNDDAPSSSQPEEYFYSVKIQMECPSETAEIFRYCVNKETHDMVKQDVRDFRDNFPNEPCIPIGFVDIEGTQRNGVYKAAETHINWNPCAED